MTLVQGCFHYYYFFLTLLWKDEAGKPYPFPGKASSVCQHLSCHVRYYLKTTTVVERPDYMRDFSLQLPYSVAHSISCLAFLCCWEVHKKAKQEINIKDVLISSFCRQTGRYNCIHTEWLRAWGCIWSPLPALSTLLPWWGDADSSFQPAFLPGKLTNKAGLACPLPLQALHTVNTALQIQSRKWVKMIQM